MKTNRTHKEKCLHCGEQYIPSRKGAQKFCSASCRSRYWILNNKKNSTSAKISTTLEKTQNEKEKTNPTSVNKIDKMSIAGIGNSFTGALAANVTARIVKNAFKREDDYPATKGDVKKIIDLINSRYFQVHNVSFDEFGRIPYFDMATSKIVFYDESQNVFELPKYNLK